MKHSFCRGSKFLVFLVQVVIWLGMLEGGAVADDYKVTVLPPYRAQAIAAGESHSVALTNDSTVVAWGNNESDQTTIPSGLSGITSIAAGGDHTVALRKDGTVIAWGWNYYGQTTIAAGDAHTVALKSDGTVVAGDNYFGEIAVPEGLNNVIAIAADSLHTVSLKNDGTVVAWGDNVYGQTTVPPGLNNVIAIAAGRTSTGSGPSRAA